jgi:hypothetical protein
VLDTVVTSASWRREVVGSLANKKKGKGLVRRTILLLGTMLAALVVAGGVAFALSDCTWDHYCNCEKATAQGVPCEGTNDKRPGYWDAIYGTNSSDRIYGYAGGDELYGYNGNDYMAGGSGNDYLIESESYGASGNDRLAGGADNDHIEGGDGYDVCNGGSGFDRASGCERTTDYIEGAWE